MTGKELKSFIDDSRISIDELVRKSGIKERTLYNLYKVDKVKKFYLEDIAKAGVKLPLTAVETDISKPVNDKAILETIESNKHYRIQIDRMLTIIETMSSGKRSVT